MPNVSKMINKKRNLFQYSEHIIDIKLHFFMYKTKIIFCLAVKTKIYSFLQRTLFSPDLYCIPFPSGLKQPVLFFSTNDSSLQNNSVVRCCAGLCIDILTVMSSRMQFDYELYEVPDRTWGLPDQVGNLCFAVFFITLDYASNSKR